MFESRLVGLECGETVEKTTTDIVKISSSTLTEMLNLF
jgi:hypothetical protein